MKSVHTVFMFVFIKKSKLTLIILLCLFFLSGCSADDYGKLVLPNSQTIKVKIARSETEFTRGLSGIKKIVGYDGMFFVNAKPEKVSFWMKDMKFPLDIIYLDENLVVVDVFLNKQACLGEICESIKSRSDNVQYILELPAGLANKYNLEIGKSVKTK